MSEKLIHIFFFRQSGQHEKTTIFSVFVCSINNVSYTPWYNESDTEERNQRAKKAYTSLLTVTAMTPENKEYDKFSKEVILNFSSLCNSSGKAFDFSAVPL